MPTPKPKSPPVSGYLRSPFGGISFGQRLRPIRPLPDRDAPICAYLIFALFIMGLCSCIAFFGSLAN